MELLLIWFKYCNNLIFIVINLIFFCRSFFSLRFVRLFIVIKIVVFFKELVLRYLIIVGDRFINLGLLFFKL